MSTIGSAVPAVEIRGLTKSFEGGRRRAANGRHRAWLPSRPKRAKLALDHLDLDIEPGAITGVIGLNGSGKSTLIRILATLTTPDAGEARVFGLDVVRDASTVRRYINRVSAEAAFFKEMSPWENLQYAARLYGEGSGSTRRDAERILSQLGLPRSALDRPMKGLSRGQQQKVAITRSLLSSPNLLLMDEPTTGLDPRSKREVQNFVRHVHREQGATVILCTHDLDEAAQLCSRVVLLDQGRVLADGAPDELCQRYPNSNDAETTLEDVFLRLSGRSFAEDTEDEPEDVCVENTG